MADRVVVDTDKKVFVPADKRKVGMVFQSYALWPHLSVAENVAYPLKVARLGSQDRQSRVQEMLQAVGLAGYEKRPVTALSGGQQQRVALARAMAARPGIIFYDEPLSNLDSKLRYQMGQQVRALHNQFETTSVYVTHDQEEAITLSDRIIVMSEGNIVQDGRAFNRWLTEVILPPNPRLKGMLYLPYNTPEVCEELVEKYADDPGIIGYTVCSTRNNPVHSDVYTRLYKLIEDSGKPLAFHSGYHWGDPSFAQLNRFLSMHALSFTHYNQIHVTNWIINAMPERFPKLKMVWVESGLAWIPFLMQRLDHEVLMRPSEAPGLKRLPSEYMKEMWYTTQPMERTNMELLEATFKSFNAETQLLYSSDWPHWDWDAPSTITRLPFLSEQAKRNILGLNAAKLFNLPTDRMKPSAADVLRDRPGVS